MKIEPKAIYTNLKNWDFAILGPYKLNEEEAEAIKEIFEQNEKRGASIENNTDEHKKEMVEADSIREENNRDQEDGAEGN